MSVTLHEMNENYCIFIAIESKNYRNRS